MRTTHQRMSQPAPEPGPLAFDLATWWLLKRDPSKDRDVSTTYGPLDEEWYVRIRCPRCAWQPRPSSRWCCTGNDPSMPSFQGCGTVWNTFTTGGRCPGCAHRWHWTKCLHCASWSRHVEWYGDDGRI
ncbi:MAG TPA: hypothetical protein VFV95_04505 [Vicinamibacterales bacterium]|nr:hypothetical protein [Vicinamibacterales bacterium]